jgi:hypothetical protein
MQDSRFTALAIIAANSGGYITPEPPRKQRRRHNPSPYVGREVNRNDPCPCGSGKKYKKCCMRQAAKIFDALEPTR